MILAITPKLHVSWLRMEQLTHQVTRGVSLCTTQEKEVGILTVCQIYDESM